ncbi:Ankyrin repeat protein [Rickettsiales bacterium Ac37b]|nr:Ankyrin repeat protein [Rickettsiales bacterium Ac37b]
MLTQEQKKFFNMVKIGDIEILKSMLQSSPNLLHTKDEQGRTAIHIAASCGINYIIEFLEKEGIPINEKTLDGSTPLSLATKDHHTDIVQFLQQKPQTISNINSVSNPTQSSVLPLSNKDIVENLRRIGQNIHNKDNSPHTIPTFQPVQPLSNSNMNPTPITQSNPSSFSNNNNNSAHANLTDKIHSLIKANIDLKKDNTELKKANNEKDQALAQKNLEILQLKYKLEFAEQLISKNINVNPSVNSQNRNNFQTQTEGTRTTSTSSATTPFLTQINNNISEKISNNEIAANIEPLEVIATLATIKSETPNLTFQERENRKRSVNSAEIGSNKNSRTV